MSDAATVQSARTVTMRLPEDLYLRLQQTAQATRQSLEATMLRALQIGSPPAWETAPAEFQADLAALDRLDDAALWRMARTRAIPAQMDRYQALLDKNANRTLSSDERQELTQLRTDLDRQMLLKAHAAALLQWRGHQIPPADKL
jgi:predicted transcriptional regulator